MALKNQEDLERDAAVRAARNETRRARRRAKLGYVLAAAAATLGVWGVTQYVDNRLREDLNHIAEANCLGAISTYEKYNDLVQHQIETQREAIILNLARGDKARAALNRRAVTRLTKDKIDVPAPEECSRPLLP